MIVSSSMCVGLCVSVIVMLSVMLSMVDVIVDVSVSISDNVVLLSGLFGNVLIKRYGRFESNSERFIVSVLF